MSVSVGQRIRLTRQARGISLRQLAREVGIDHSHLSKVENDKDNVGHNTLVRIAEALNADAGVLLGAAGFRSMPYRLVGDIAAGEPTDAMEHVESFDLTEHFDPDEHFMLRVRGDSMVLDGINDGDLAILREASTARKGDTVAAVVNGEDATLKRFRKEQLTVFLTPANDTMQEMSYPASCVEIKGVLVGVMGFQ